MHSVTSNAVAVATSITENNTVSTSKWLLQEFSNGFIIGYAWNKNTVTFTSRDAFTFYTPSGFKVSRIISGCAFADGQSDNVTGAIHIAGANNNRISMYGNAGTYYANNLRVSAFLERV